MPATQAQTPPMAPRDEATAAATGDAQPPPPRPGLRTHLLALTLSVLVPALGIGLFAAKELTQSHRATFEARLTGTAATLAQALDEQILAHLAVARTLAASPMLRDSAASDLPAFERQARGAAAALDSWVVVWGPGPDYPRLLDTHVRPTDAPLPADLALMPGRAPVPQVFATGEPLVTDLGVGPVRREPAALILVPVRGEDGRASLVVGVGLNPARIVRLLRQAALSDGVVATVVDGRGRIVARSRDHAHFVGQVAPEWFRTSVEYADNDLLEGRPLSGERLRVAFRRLGQAHWTVAVGAPAAVLESASRIPLLLLAAGGVGLLALGTVLALLLARRVMLPVAALARAAARNGRTAGAGAPPGRSDLHAVPPARIAEIEVLRRALLSADEALRERVEHERRAAEHRNLLLLELSHRVKNALAVVQSVVRLTPRSDPDRYAAAVEGRVSALARAHSLLSDRDWTGADLRALAESELSPFARAGRGEAGPRVEFQGPPIALDVRAVQPLAMVLHELATNAAKHGGLSADGGRVRIRWSIDEAGALRLRWEESGGPALSGPPAKLGFGSRLLKATVQGQLGGTIGKTWSPEGMVCEISLPAGSLMPPRRNEADNAPAPRDQRSAAPGHTAREAGAGATA